MGPYAIMAVRLLGGRPAIRTLYSLQESNFSSRFEVILGGPKDLVGL